MSTSYDNYIHSLLEPNEIIIMGKQKRDKELPGWMHQVPSMSNEERERIEHEHEQMEDEYLKKHGII